MAKKKKKNIPQAVAHIHSNHNNTIITFAEKNGNVIAWSSSGAIGYKGTKKSTPYAANLAAAAACEKVKENGVKEVEVFIKGVGPGKESARKQIEVSGIKITKVIDVTPVPYNGTRKPRKYYKRLSKRK